MPIPAPNPKEIARFILLFWVLAPLGCFLRLVVSHEQALGESAAKGVKDLVGSVSGAGRYDLFSVFLPVLLFFPLPFAQVGVRSGTLVVISKSFFLALVCFCLVGWCIVRFF